MPPAFDRDEPFASAICRLALHFECSKCHMSSLGTSVPLLKVVQTIAGETDCSGIEALEAYDILKNSGVKVSLYVLLFACLC